MGAYQTPVCRRKVTVTISKSHAYKLVQRLDIGRPTTDQIKEPTSALPDQGVQVLELLELLDQTDRQKGEVPACR